MKVTFDIESTDTGYILTVNSSGAIFNFNFTHWDEVTDVITSELIKVNTIETNKTKHKFTWTKADSILGAS